jgi:hypothetical protein
MPIAGAQKTLQFSWVDENPLSLHVSPCLTSDIRHVFCSFPRQRLPEKPLANAPPDAVAEVQGKNSDHRERHESQKMPPPRFTAGELMHGRRLCLAHLPFRVLNDLFDLGRDF